MTSDYDMSITDESLVNLKWLMEDINNNCTLPYPFVRPKVGSHNGRWYSTHIRKEYLPSKCDLALLVSYEHQLIGKTAGPLDICYAYAWFGLQYVEITHNGSIPIGFREIVREALRLAFPLNDYLSALHEDPYTTILVYEASIQKYLSEVRDFNTNNRQGQPPSFDTYLPFICNNYFGSDDLSSYYPSFQPALRSLIKDYFHTQNNRAILKKITKSTWRAEEISDNL